MGFKKDLEQSQIAVDLVLDQLIDRGLVAHELEGKKEQGYGDIRYYGHTGSGDIPTNLEIKYDLMSHKTGNMCFEIANGRGMTGIMKTKADKIVYVCPVDDGHDVYFFNPENLKKYLLRTGNKNVRFVNGGDRKKFHLALVSVGNILLDRKRNGLIDIWEVHNA